MRAGIDTVVDKLPDSMPQWLDVPEEKRQGITEELKAMFPDDGGIAPDSKKQVRELIGLTCKTCLEAASAERMRCETSGPSSS